jgi:hypothetical protein
VTGTFALLEADDDRWTALWECSPEREVWAHPSYARLYEASGADAVCASWESADGCVLYPLLLRNLGTEPWWELDIGPATDIVSPYGYGGPFFWGRDRPAVAAAFWPSFQDWAGSVGAVSELVRFSLFSDELLPYPGETEVRRQNVVRDLAPDSDALWMDVKHKVRKNVKRARREGVTVEVDPTGARFDEFLALYLRTMERRGAGEEYFFSPQYFERIVRRLPGEPLFFHAVFAGRVVSSQLVLRSATSAYSFLGGSDERAFNTRPNDLLKWEILLSARQEGFRRFVLGGGLEMEDGIFRHKLAFAPAGRMPFRVGHRVLRPEVYERLIKVRARADPQWSPRPGWFPVYRA